MKFQDYWNDLQEIWMKLVTVSNCKPIVTKFEDFFFFTNYFITTDIIILLYICVSHSGSSYLKIIVLRCITSVRNNYDSKSEIYVNQRQYIS